MSDYKMLGCEEIAVILECHPETVADLFIRKVLPGTKFGRGWRVTEKALFSVLDQLCLDNLPEKSNGSGQKDIPAGLTGKPAAYLMELPGANREAANSDRARPGRRRAPIPKIPPFEDAA